MALVALPWKWLTDAPHMHTLVFAQWVIKNLPGGISLPSHWRVRRRAEEKPSLLSKLERKDSRNSWHETENNSVLNYVVPTLRTAGFERRTEVLVLILLLAISVASGKWSDTLQLCLLSCKIARLDWKGGFQRCSVAPLSFLGGVLGTGGRWKANKRNKWNSKPLAFILFIVAILWLSVYTGLPCKISFRRKDSISLKYLKANGPDMIHL